ncbi:hypothetical protein [Actinocrispum sp. NPDC049592]|uniref:hypothetical protein n=1 Tax=Actinocrispum sp. NPDC049592 TaxID=3154835 RepID=UPI0034427DAD
MHGDDRDFLGDVTESGWDGLPAGLTRGDLDAYLLATLDLAPHFPDSIDNAAVDAYCLEAFGDINPMSATARGTANRGITGESGVTSPQVHPARGSVQRAQRRMAA